MSVANGEVQPTKKTRQTKDQSHKHIKTCNELNTLCFPFDNTSG